jgi:hypothetical protein
LVLLNEVEDIAERGVHIREIIVTDAEARARRRHHEPELGRRVEKVAGKCIRIHVRARDAIPVDFAPTSRRRTGDCGAVLRIAEEQAIFLDLRRDVAGRRQDSCCGRNRFGGIVVVIVVVIARGDEQNATHGQEDRTDHALLARNAIGPRRHGSDLRNIGNAARTQRLENCLPDRRRD